MATENLRDKIANLESLIKNDEVQMYLQQCVVEDAATSIGDDQLDDELKQLAQTARAVIVHCERKLSVRRPKLAALIAERDAAPIV